MNKETKVKELKEKIKKSNKIIKSLTLTDMEDIEVYEYDSKEKLEQARRQLEVIYCDKISYSSFNG